MLKVYFKRNLYISRTDKLHTTSIEILHTYYKLLNNESCKIL